MRTRDESRARYEEQKRSGQAILETIRRNGLLPKKTLEVFEIVHKEGPISAVGAKKHLGSVSVFLVKSKLEHLRRFYKVLDFDQGMYRVNQTLPLDKRPQIVTALTPFEEGFNAGLRATLSELKSLGVQFDKNQLLSLDRILKKGS